MPLPPFDYVAARTVEEALDLWRGRPRGAYFAGGTDLLPQMRLGRRAPATIIDVKRIAGLDQIRETETQPRHRRRGVAGGHRGAPGCPGRLPAARRMRPGGRRAPAAPSGHPGGQHLQRLAGGGHGRRPARPRRDGENGGRGRCPGAAGDGVLHRTGPDGACIPASWSPRSCCPARARGAGRYLRLSRRRGMDLATVGVLVACSNGDDRATPPDRALRRGARPVAGSRGGGAA